MKTLIVEDDFTSRMVLQEMVKELGPTHIAVNGMEAVAAAAASIEAGEPYQLICMDIQMPGMDGQVAIKQIRKLEEAAGVVSTDGSKIIMTTGSGALKDVSKAYQGLCDAYLVKPIDKARFYKELSALGLIGSER